MEKYRSMFMSTTAPHSGNRRWQDGRSQLKWLMSCAPQRDDRYISTSRYQQLNPYHINQLQIGISSNIQKNRKQHVTSTTRQWCHWASGSALILTTTTRWDLSWWGRNPEPECQSPSHRWRERCMACTSRMCTSSDTSLGFVIALEDSKYTFMFYSISIPIHHLFLSIYMSKYMAKRWTIRGNE